ncbi:MAG: alpha/beta hydrolase [Pseudomonadota bacterium]
MPRFQTSDGLSLDYEDSGAGRPLLCLPGLTRNARDFDDLRAVLPAGWRMIVLTARGRGASDWAADPAQYAVPIEAHDAVELLDHLGLQRATMVGTSRGGILAMFIAATARDRLNGVLLNDVGPELAATGLDRISDYLGRRPAGQTYDEVAQALKLTMGAEFPDVTEARWRVLAERWFVEDDQGVGLRYDPRLADAVKLSTEAGPPPDMWPLFVAFGDMPVAVLRGENSDLLTAESVARMAERHPGLIARTVPDRGHVPFLDEPESLAALEALLAAVPE